jgi:tRNA dimethylallyltransferase
VNEKIIIIVGPTASGKTACAIELAEHFNGEVISADSRQVYHDLDIGTEKITTDEMRGIPHHLIGHVDVNDVYTAASFAKDAERLIEDIAGRGKVPIIAGGTFFYIDALMGAAVLPEVPPDSEFREKMELLPAATLFGALEKLDPRRAAEIDPQNKRRLIRALEIVKALGVVPPPVQADAPHDALWIGLSVPKEELRVRLAARAERALERGLIEETKQLLESGVSKERLEEIGLEYPLVMEYLDNTISKESLLQKLTEKNWQYANRQLSWLKRNQEIQWVTSTDEALKLTGQFLSS